MPIRYPYASLATVEVVDRRLYAPQAITTEAVAVLGILDCDGFGSALAYSDLNASGTLPTGVPEAGSVMPFNTPIRVTNFNQFKQQYYANPSVGPINEAYGAISDILAQGAVDVWFVRLDMTFVRASSTAEDVVLPVQQSTGRIPDWFFGDNFTSWKESLHLNPASQYVPSTELRSLPFVQATDTITPQAHVDVTAADMRYWALSEAFDVLENAGIRQVVLGIPPNYMNQAAAKILYGRYPVDLADIRADVDRGALGLARIEQCREKGMPTFNNANLSRVIYTLNSAGELVAQSLEGTGYGTQVITLNGVSTGDSITISAGGYSKEFEEGTDFNLGTTDALTASNLATAINSVSNDTGPRVFAEAEEVNDEARLNLRSLVPGAEGMITVSTADDDNFIITGGILDAIAGVTSTSAKTRALESSPSFYSDERVTKIHVVSGQKFDFTADAVTANMTSDNSVGLEVTNLEDGEQRRFDYVATTDFGVHDVAAAYAAKELRDAIRADVESYYDNVTIPQGVQTFTVDVSSVDNDDYITIDGTDLSSPLVFTKKAVSSPPDKQWVTASNLADLFNDVTYGLDVVATADGDVVTVVVSEGAEYTIVASDASITVTETVAEHRTVSIFIRGHKCRFDFSELEETTALYETVAEVTSYTAGDKLQITTDDDDARTLTASGSPGTDTTLFPYLAEYSTRVASSIASRLNAWNDLQTKMVCILTIEDVSIAKDDVISFNYYAPSTYTYTTISKTGAGTATTAAEQATEFANAFTSNPLPSGYTAKAEGNTVIFTGPNLYITVAAGVDVETGCTLDQGAAQVLTTDSRTIEVLSSDPDSFVVEEEETPTDNSDRVYVEIYSHKSRPDFPEASNIILPEQAISFTAVDANSCKYEDSENVPDTYEFLKSVGIGNGVDDYGLGHQLRNVLTAAGPETWPIKEVNVVGTANITIDDNACNGKAIVVSITPEEDGYGDDQSFTITWNTSTELTASNLKDAIQAWYVDKMGDSASTWFRVSGSTVYIEAVNKHADIVAGASPDGYTIGTNAQKLELVSAVPGYHGILVICPTVILDPTNLVNGDVVSFSLYDPIADDVAEDATGTPYTVELTYNTSGADTDQNEFGDVDDLVAVLTALREGGVSWIGRIVGLDTDNDGVYDEVHVTRNANFGGRDLRISKILSSSGIDVTADRSAVIKNQILMSTEDEDKLVPAYGTEGDATPSTSTVERSFPYLIGTFCYTTTIHITAARAAIPSEPVSQLLDGRRNIAQLGTYVGRERQSLIGQYIDDVAGTMFTDDGTGLVGFENCKYLDGIHRIHIGPDSPSGYGMFYTTFAMNADTYHDVFMLAAGLGDSLQADPEGNAVDLGAYLDYVAGDYASTSLYAREFSRSTGTLLTSAAAAYAGLRMVLDIRQATTGQPIAAVRPITEFSLPQLDALTKARFTAIEIDPGDRRVKVHSGVAGSWKIDDDHKSDFTRAHTVDLLHFVIREFRKIWSAYRGKTMSPEIGLAFSNKIQNRLMDFKKEGILMSPAAQVRISRRNHSAEVAIEFVDPGELEKCRTTIGLRPE